MSVNISLIVLKKMYDNVMILVDFLCGNFPWFWLIFGYPDPADQNETDPNGSGSETLLETQST